MQTVCQALVAASAAPVEGSRSKVVPRITVSIDLHGIRPYVKFFHVRAYPVDFFICWVRALGILAYRLAVCKLKV
jgi:hypothetical protein